MIMVIFADFGSDVQRYQHEFSKLVFHRLDNCPGCGSANKLIGHGSYPRHVCDHHQNYFIRIKRFFCKLCHHTVSLLPSFCLPHRHYLAQTIQTVLSLRIQVGYSWKTIRSRFSPSELPSLVTCREWTTAFANASATYLQHLLRQLANWQLAPGRLELAVDDISTKPSPPGQLLATVPHLLAWLHEQGRSFFEGPTGSIDWLASLSRWGHAAKLGRLV